MVELIDHGVVCDFHEAFHSVSLSHYTLDLCPSLVVQVVYLIKV